DSPEATVSRIHARIWHDQGGWWLADLGSTNGTRWNGEKVGREAAGPLLPLHLVQLGNVCLRVESVTAPASLEPPVEPDPCKRSPGVTVALREWVRVRVGPPARYRSLTVFPLFSEGNPAVEYLLSDEAVAAGTFSVQEVSQQGSVPELSVENRGDRRVLLLE